MRNSKVRKRIAAGKIRLRIRDLRNLGPRTEAQLAEIGIYTPTQLRRAGALATFIRLRRASGTRSLNALWALRGALEPWPEGEDWREVARSDQRLAVLMELERLDPEGKAAKKATGARKSKPGRARKAADKSASNVFEGEAWAPGLPFDEGSGS